MNVTIAPRLLHGTITPPPSKSQGHRALIAATLAGRESLLSNLGHSQDITVTRDCLAALAAPGPHLPRLDCGESGSTLRFLIPLALVLRGGGIFSGRGRLMARPQEPYFQIFRERGILYERADDHLLVQGALTPGTYAIRGDVSSQFITGLLFALSLLPEDSKIHLTTPLESKGYVDMTLDVQSKFGVTITHEDHQVFHIPGGQIYQPHTMAIESDYSQSAFWYAAMGLGSTLEIQGLNPHSFQGDQIITTYFNILCKPGPVELDVSQCPDLVPALAVQAALRAGETTRIVGAARLRIKESDRLSTVSTELNALGAQVEEGADYLLIHGVDHLTGGRVSGHNDHRIAMMLAIAATRAQGSVTIEYAESVAKSYPTFWEDYESLGGVYV